MCIKSDERYGLTKEFVSDDIFYNFFKKRIKNWLKIYKLYNELNNTNCILP